MTTEPAAQMKQIVAALAPTLKEAGFRKRRHTFNRRTSETVTHVVNFQMGPYDPPGTVEVPPIRVNLYGQFAVNLGVFSRRLHLMDYQVKNWVNEYQCQLRKRLGELTTDGQSDLWWHLDGPPSDVEQDVRKAMVDKGLTWLDGFPDDQTILDAYQREGRDRLGMAPRAPLDIAALQIALGDREGALATARSYLAEEDMNPHHRPTAEQTVEKLGLHEALRRS